MMNRRRELVRSFYFMEAMAVYQNYYSPLKESMDVAPGGDLPNRQEDRPLTWVPIVFHCTTAEEFPRIVEAGCLDSPVSLTEIPIGELDRMKIRHGGASQIAIGFPRTYLQEIGFAPVITVRYMPHIKEVLRRFPQCEEALRPFIEVNEDLSSFQEIRTVAQLDLGESVWILTTDKAEPCDGKPALVLPARELFEEKFGKISCSYWHRSHQMEVLKEWQFLQIIEEKPGQNTYRTLGEYYYKKLTAVKTQQTVSMPKGRKFDLNFQDTGATSGRFEGPLKFFGVAQRLRQLIKEEYPDEPLRYSLMDWNSNTA